MAKIDSSFCQHCHRMIYRRDDGAWDLVYLEYANTQMCDARGDGAVLSSLPHEPSTEPMTEEQATATELYDAATGMLGLPITFAEDDS